MGEVHLKQINQVTGSEKDKYEFEDLSKKIVRVAIRSTFRDFVISCFRDYL